MRMFIVAISCLTGALTYRVLDQQIPIKEKTEIKPKKKKANITLIKPEVKIEEQNGEKQDEQNGTPETNIGISTATN